MLNIENSPLWKSNHLTITCSVFCLLCQTTLPVEDFSSSHFLTHICWCYFGYWITWFTSSWMVNYIIGFYVYMTTSIHTSPFCWANPATSGMSVGIVIIASCLTCWVCISCQSSCVLFTLLGTLKESSFVLFWQGRTTRRRRHRWTWNVCFCVSNSSSSAQPWAC